MAIKYLRPEALLGSNADDDYLRTVLKYGDTTEYTAHIKACKDYGITATQDERFEVIIVVATREVDTVNKIAARLAQIAVSY